jgi:hypothetical protein
MPAPRKPWVPGTPCAICRTSIENSDDRYKGKGRLCKTCGNDTRRQQREAARALTPVPCRSCGTPMTDGREKRFGRCGGCKAANAGICDCGAPVHIGKRCIDCYRIAQAAAQRARRHGEVLRCKCGAKITKGSMCRPCAGLIASAAAKVARERKTEPEVLPPPRNIGAAWPGLRGPGGEWEHGPTLVASWATLDGGRA